MRQLVISYKHPAKVVEVPSPSLKSGGILVQTSFSAISIGTEGTAASYGHMNIAQKAISRPDQVKSVLTGIKENGFAAMWSRVSSALGKWSPSGYSCSGTVVEVGSRVSEFRLGDRIACAGGGYAVHAEFCSVPKRMATLVPASVDLKSAAFTAIGSVALHGFRISEAQLCERVAIVGLGMVGQILTQICAAAGVDVTTFDIAADRVDLSVTLGARKGFVIGDGIGQQQIDSMTDGRGFDVVFVAAASSSDSPSALALSLARDRGRIVIVGDVPLNLDRQVMYDKELELRVSRSYGPGRYDRQYEEQGIDYPYSYVRWSQQRNMEAFLSLLENKKIDLSKLITNSYFIDQADRAFSELVEPKGRKPLGVVLEFPKVVSPKVTRSIRGDSSVNKKSGRVGIGFIGPGSFARNILLPSIMKQNVSPEVIAGSSSVSTSELGKRFRFLNITTNLEELFSNPNVDVVMIASRHDSHAKLVVDSLNAGKHVFVEKPLALNIEDLEKVIEAYNKSDRYVMVGFNRRFSPFVKKMKSFFGDSHGPLVLNIRINAGPADKGHWSVSEAVGGGRILGEVCHFVDLAGFLCGSKVVNVFSRSIRKTDGSLEENICATLSFSDGSVANIVYTSLGDTKLAKEYIEIFGDGKCGVLDDYKNLRLISNGKLRSESGKQDKGFFNEAEAFYNHVALAGSVPIPFVEVVSSTLATLALLDSARTGKSCDVSHVSLLSN